MPFAAARASCMGAEIDIEVVCALPQRQHLLAVRVPAGCTVAEAVRRSGIAALVPEVDVESAALGIFGQPVEHPGEQVLAAGDRVEIYRPLLQDPRTARRKRARG